MISTEDIEACRVPLLDFKAAVIAASGLDINFKKVSPISSHLSICRTQHTMRRISRLDRSIGLLNIRPSTNVLTINSCAACNHQATSFSTSLQLSKEKPVLTERIRRKIWGTDQPPGLEDPYGGDSIIEQTKKQRQAQIAEEDAMPEEDAMEMIQEDTSGARRETRKKSKVKGNMELKPKKGKLQAKRSQNENVVGSRQPDPQYMEVKFIGNRTINRVFRSWDDVEHTLRAATRLGRVREYDRQYVPATTSDGLLEIGFESPLEGKYWDAFHPYPAFSVNCRLIPVAEGVI